MAATETLLIELVAKVDGVQKAVDKIDRDVSGFGKTVGKVGKAIGGAFAAGAVLDFANQSIGAFSNLEQSTGGVRAVFEEAAATVEGFAARSADSVGLATSEYQTLATALGGQLKASGALTNLQDIATETDGLIGIAADLAATYGGTTQEAVDALGAAFRGEADSAERFNLQLKASKVAAKAVELGLADSTAQVDDAARATALMTLIQEQSTDALGQFGREADTVAGKQQRLTAKWEDAQAEIGQALVPILITLFDALEPLIPTIVSLVESLAPLIVALVPIVELIGELAADLIPILVAVVEPLAELLGAVLTPIVSALGDAFDWVAEQIRRVVDWLKRIKIPSWLRDAGSWLGNLFSAPPTGAAVTRSLSASALGATTARAGSISSWSGSTGSSAVAPMIVIQTGVGDPVEIGRQVVGAISAYERTNGPTWRL